MDEFSQTVLDIILLLKEADCLKYSEKFCKTRVIHGFLSFMECLLDLPGFLQKGDAAVWIPGCTAQGDCL